MLDWEVVEKEASEFTQLRTAAKKENKQYIGYRINGNSNPKEETIDKRSIPKQKRKMQSDGINNTKEGENKSKK